MQTIVYQCDTAMPAQKLPNCCTHKAMKKENTTLSSFISTLDAEILKEDEAILLTGGFASATTTVDAKSNYGCNTDNCPCPITNNCKSDDLISHT